MFIFKSLITLATTPIRYLGEVGKDLSTLTDLRKDESLCTLGTSSVVKGIVKSIKKAGEELDVD